MFRYDRGFLALSVGVLMASCGCPERRLVTRVWPVPISVLGFMVQGLRRVGRAEPSMLNLPMAKSQNRQGPGHT